MKLPIILGLPLPILGGIFLFILIVFQVLNGIKLIKVPFAVHKFTAFLILLLAILHAIGGLGIWFGWFSIG
jgi:predicted ferric reductase